MNRQQFDQRLAQAISLDPQSPSMRESLVIGLDLRGAVLSTVDFRFCRLEWCDLRGAELPPAEKLEGADLSNSWRRTDDPPVEGWRTVECRLYKDHPPVAPDDRDPDTDSSDVDIRTGTGWLADSSFPRR